MGRAMAVIEEAEQVATELYGVGMTPRQQQEFMFNKVQYATCSSHSHVDLILRHRSLSQQKTVSVWDLADFEHESVMSGQEVPWRNDKYDTKTPEDVIGERVRRIGGSGAEGSSP